MTTVYIESPKESVHKLLETDNYIITFSKIAGYKINTQKSVTLLYNTMSMWRLKLKTIPPKKMISFKYTDVINAEHVSDNYRMLMKEFKDSLSILGSGAIGIYRSNNKSQPKLHILYKN